jgi:PhzF family phenazine biosynthesis protein
MKTYIVDAFTAAPFKGNPAGVCFVEQNLSEVQMLNIATELGFSETAFVKATGKAGTYTIRYFSPKKETPLCGHATLASAKTIFSNTSLEEILFITIENLQLLIKRQGSEIVMEFPVYNTVAATVPPAMLEALGIGPVSNTAFNAEKSIYIVEINNAGWLAALTPDFKALVNTCTNINGVVVTAPANDGEYDFHYRYFWPWSGTDEDPVTGGVQTFLAKYWADKLGKTQLKAFQCSARTGSMRLNVQAGKVWLTGNAVIMLEGDLKVVE